LDNVTVHEVERLQPLFTDEKELENSGQGTKKIPYQDGI